LVLKAGGYTRKETTATPLVVDNRDSGSDRPKKKHDTEPRSLLQSEASSMIVIFLQVIRSGSQGGGRAETSGEEGCGPGTAD